ncbi:MAG: hypothetical protein IBJ18_10225 [Phycisphaerales bacterium]|nr:hypothetical protein [Phycisphaerales bacterium]
MNRLSFTAAGLMWSAGVCCAQPFPAVSTGSLSGGPSIAYSISVTSNTAVGHSDFTSGSQRAFLFASPTLWPVPNGTGFPSGTTTPYIGRRINNALTTVGAGITGINSRAFRFDGGTIDLGTPSGFPTLVNTDAFGINNNGLIVGKAWDSAVNPSTFAFKYVPTGPTTGNMTLIFLREAYDVNDTDFAVGMSTSGSAQGLNLVNNTFTNFGSFGGSGAGAGLSVNNVRQTVGYTSHSSGFTHAFFWSPSGGMTDINPSVFGAVTSIAYDINSIGMAVGYYVSASTGIGNPAGNNGHAYVYYNGLFRDLNTWLPPSSGWVLERAYGINDNNCVVGRGNFNGVTKGFVMCIQPLAPLPPPCPPIVTDPIGIAQLCPTNPIALSVGATGDGPIEVQWQYVYAGDPHRRWNVIADGVNEFDGTPIFNASVSAAGTNAVELTPLGGTRGGGTWGKVPAAYMVRAVAWNPCGVAISNSSTLRILGSSCSPADVAYDDGTPLGTNGTCGSTSTNGGVNEGDYNAFFSANGFFDQASMGPAAIGMFCDVADDQGEPLPVGLNGATTNGAANSGVNEGDYNGFFNSFFVPCV